VAAFHLAEINVARLRAPLDDPRLADFVAQLDDVNALADASPGFVWRLKAEGGGASSYVRAFEDERLIVNLSVWSSVEALFAFVYRGRHLDVFRARGRWMEPLGSPPVALWWLRAGELPSVVDGQARLELLARNGPSPDAFTFRETFPPPG